MKKIIHPLAFALFTFSSLFTACKSSAEKIENAEENGEDAQAKLDEARKDSAAEYEQSKADWTIRIAKNDQRGYSICAVYSGRLNVRRTKPDWQNLRKEMKP